MRQPAYNKLDSMRLWFIEKADAIESRNHAREPFGISEMKTLCRIQDRNKVLDRLTGVRPESQRRWGSMSPPSDDLSSERFLSGSTRGKTGKSVHYAL